MSVEERIKTLQEGGLEEQVAFLQNGGWTRLNDWIRQSCTSQNNQRLKILLKFMAELPLCVIESMLQTEFILVPTLETIVVQVQVGQGQLGTSDENGIRLLLGQLLGNWRDILHKLDERKDSRQEQQREQLLSGIDDSVSTSDSGTSTSAGEDISEEQTSQSNENEGVVNSKQIREPGPVVVDLVVSEKMSGKLIKRMKRKRNTKEEQLKVHEEEKKKTKRLRKAIKKVKKCMKIRAEHQRKPLLIEPYLFKKRKPIKMLEEGQVSMDNENRTCAETQQTVAVAVPTKRQGTGQGPGRQTNVKVFLKGKSRVEEIVKVMEEFPLKTRHRHQVRNFHSITSMQSKPLKLTALNVENTIGTKAASMDVAIIRPRPVVVPPTPLPRISKAIVSVQSNLSLQHPLKATVSKRELSTATTTHKTATRTEGLSSRQSSLDLGHRLPSSASTSACTALVPYKPPPQIPRRTTEPTTSMSTTNTVPSSLWHLDPRKKSWELAHAAKEKGFQQLPNPLPVDRDVIPLLEIEGRPWKLLKIHLPDRMARRQRRRKILSVEKEIQRLREMLYPRPGPPSPDGYCSSVPDSPAEPSPVNYSPVAYVHIRPYGTRGYTQEFWHKKHPWPDAQQDDNVKEIRAVHYIRRQKNATPTMKQITFVDLTMSPARQETEECQREKSNRNPTPTRRLPVTDTLSLSLVPYPSSPNSWSPPSSPRFSKTPSHHASLVAGQEKSPLPINPPLPGNSPPPVNPPLPTRF